jgi:GMP synthase-like glutamine amidotransferase
MKIAILQTDHIPAHRQQYSGGNYPEMFANLFFKLSVIIDIDVFDVTIGEYPDNYDEYDGFIITGSKATAFEKEPWIVELKIRIKDIFDKGKKIIGICFGHQVIVEALGGRVERSKNGFAVGIRNVHVIEEKAWMIPYYKHLNLLFYHQDMVVELPKDAELIGTSDYCDVQIFSYKNLVLGIQAHPEMLKVHNHALMKEYEESIKSEFQHALDSLRIRDNSLVLGQWMTNFFRNSIG